MKPTKDRELRRRHRDAPGLRLSADQLLSHAIQKFKSGSLIEARALAEEALKQRPTDPQALNILGTILTKLGDYDGIAKIFRQKIALDPKDASLRSNLSSALRLTHAPQEAVAQAREAVRLSPLDAAGHDALCLALGELGDSAGAVAAGREAVRLAPTRAFTWASVASALAHDNKIEEAEAAFLKAAQLASSEPDIWSSIGQFYLMQSRYDDALNVSRKALELRRSTEWWPAPKSPRAVPPPMPQMTNTIKLRHDIEQLKHLASRDRLPPGAERLVSSYERALGQFIQHHGTTANAPFSPDQWAEVGPAYNRVIVWDPPDRLTRSALGSFDRAEITRRYAVPPGIIWIDDFLQSQAVAALRRFCQEATIWNDIVHNFQNRQTARGYLGAYVNDGLIAPLLFQIADELIHALPDIFRHHRLIQMWAYKYESTLEGIGLHGDIAAVNVNFWITPDDANLDSEGGGLVVYPVEAPMEWNFKDINIDADRMWKFVNESGVSPVNVPYRENRAVIFNSDLFHTTAPLRFKPGYENRRINITMLFGKRGS